MHAFFLIPALHHLLIILTVSFFVLFAAGKADGIVKLFGNILGGLLFVLAILSIVFAVLHPDTGGGRNMMWFGRMHDGWGPPWPHGQPQAAPDAAPAPAAPAPATPAPAPKKP